jgi:hypothetical protein
MKLTVTKGSKLMSNSILRISNFPLMFMVFFLLCNDAMAQKADEASVFVTLFIARQADSSKIYKAKRTDISKNSQATTAKEIARQRGGKAVSSSSSESMSRSDTGGSVTRKSEKTIYKAISSKDVDNAMSKRLSEAGFETSDYDDVVSNCGGAERSKISQQFMVSDDIPRKTRSSAIKASRECEVKYFAIGSMTADVATTHQSGLKLVFVSVRGTVYDITKRLPRKVGVIGPVQYGGRGPNENIARRNALVLAGGKAAEIIVNQLNKKGLK